MKRHNLIGLTLAALILITALLWVTFRHKPITQTAPTPRGSSTTPSVADQPQPFNKTLYSTSEADSIWVVINKKRILADGYVPVDLINPNVPLRLVKTSEEMLVRKTTATAMESMFQVASKDGVTLMLASGYRSQSLQKVVYNGFVQRDGQAAADRASARPGHSEHQTGLAFDVEPASRTCEIQECFADTPEGKWVALHAYDYGFILRYGKDQETLTGYEYEPWHLRFVGVDLAKEMQQAHQTLEQFFDLPAAPNY